MMAAATIADGTLVDVYGENMCNISYRMQSLSTGMYLRHLGSMAIRMLQIRLHIETRDQD